MAKTVFHGIYPMLYTYFERNGGLDRSAMRRQVDACIAAGAHGLFAPFAVFARNLLFSAPPRLRVNHTSPAQ